MLKKVKYFIEAAAFLFFYALFRIMPQRLASKLGGFIARTIGPLIKVHKTAERNIRKSLPEKTDAEVKQILKGMWDNLGRNAGEFPHMPRMVGKRFFKHVEIKGDEHIEPIRGKPFIFYSMHSANWEIAPQMGHMLGFPSFLLYRSANNPYVEKFIQKTREKTFGDMYPKGKEGARAILKALKSNNSIAILVDQKFNEGIPVKFFGRDAMTAPAIAEYAKKFDVPIIPARVIRKPHGKFVGEFYPPVDIEGKTTAEIILGVNQQLEKWIREYPEQWFWVHNRWPK